MFSSNQIFDVTCACEDLASVIDFAVKLSGCEDMFRREGNRVLPAWQVTETGKYLLGRGSMAPGGIHKTRMPASEGWTDYPFDYDPSIIADIVNQWIEKQPVPVGPTTDGSSEIGVHITCKESLEDDPNTTYNVIKNPWSAIVVFEPYILTYDK